MLCVLFTKNRSFPYVEAKGRLRCNVESCINSDLPCQMSVQNVSAHLEFTITSNAIFAHTRNQTCLMPCLKGSTSCSIIEVYEPT